MKNVFIFYQKKLLLQTNRKRKMTKIHSYTSKEPMLKVNAFIVESPEALVIVDTTLTMSDSIALKQKADTIGKPVAGIILTHGHPDHVAGTSNISPQEDIPVYSLPSVKDLMEKTEQDKHKQWSSMFGDEWIPKWIYPDRMVANEEIVTIADLQFKVIDLGAGGDCDANSIWLLQNKEPSSAFIGDFIYKNNHTYMADGNVLRWLANLGQYETILKDYKTYYVGHGESCDVSDISKQKEYFLTYCSELLKATDGSGIFTEDTKKKFEQIILEKYPGYGCEFMVSLSADRVGSELIGSKVLQ
jgi:glyoxylase-like metal-dependent hydrolase (beta-lactamase superfamily II)